MSIYKCLSDLALRVLSVMAVGLGLVRKTKNNKSFHIFPYLCVFLLQLIIAWKLTLLKMALYVYQSIFISNSCISLPAVVLWGSFVTHSFLRGEMNAWQTNPKGRLRGGCSCIGHNVIERDNIFVPSCFVSHLHSYFAGLYLSLNSPRNQNMSQHGFLHYRVTPPCKILAMPLSLINACIHMWLLYFLECISLRKKQLTFSNTTNCFPCEMTAEGRSQKFYTDDMSQLLRSGLCFWPVEAKCQLFFQAIDVKALLQKLVFTNSKWTWNDEKVIDFPFFKTEPRCICLCLWKEGNIVRRDSVKV